MDPNTNASNYYDLSDILEIIHYYGFCNGWMLWLIEKMDVSRILEYRNL